MPATQTHPSSQRTAAIPELLEPTEDIRRLGISDRALIDQAVRGLEVLQGKWRLHLIVAMARGIRRRSRLHASLPEVSKKVMTECLRGLERDGLVTRRIYAQVPARVEYSLTPLGWTTTNAIVAFSDWDKDHSADVTTARSEFWHRHIDTTQPILQAGQAA
jgi:DNA-binding HxlR family transcriptional regulator